MRGSIGGGRMGGSIWGGISWVVRSSSGGTSGGGIVCSSILSTVSAGNELRVSSIKNNFNTSLLRNQLT